MGGSPGRASTAVSQPARAVAGGPLSAYKVRNPPHLPLRPAQKAEQPAWALLPACVEDTGGTPTRAEAARSKAVGRGGTGPRTHFQARG